MPRSHWITTLTASSLALGVVGLSGCADRSTFEDHVAKASAESTFSLPAKTDDGVEWNQAVILCPYDASVPADADEELVQAAEEIDTDADDAEQWFLLHTQQKVETVTVPRTRIDFCSQDLPEQAFTPQDRFASDEVDGARVASLQR